jgi:hypothetical protein
LKGFLDLLAQVDEEQHQEVSVSTPKFKGSIEVKNSECSTKHDARGFGSNRGKGKRAIVVM